MADRPLPQNCTVEDFHWTVGFLEGEGSFGFYGSLRLECWQVQLQPLEKLKAVIGGAICVRQKNRKAAISALTLYGSRAERWMVALRPFMSPRRQGQIDRALERYATRPKPRGEGVGGRCSRGHLVVGSNITAGARPRCKTCVQIWSRTLLDKRKVASKARRIAEGRVRVCEMV